VSFSFTFFDDSDKSKLGQTRTCFHNTVQHASCAWQRFVVSSAHRGIINDIQSKVHEKFADRHLHFHNREPHCDTAPRPNAKRLEYNRVDFAHVFQSGNAQAAFTPYTTRFFRLHQRGLTTFYLRAILQKCDHSRATANIIMNKLTDSQDLKLKRENG